MQAAPVPSRLAIGGAITGATAGSILFVGAAGVLAQSNANLKWGTAAGQGLTLAAGTATTDVNALKITQTWNNAAVAFTGTNVAITQTANAVGSRLFSITGGVDGAQLGLQLKSSGELLLSDVANAGQAKLYITPTAYHAYFNPSGVGNVLDISSSGIEVGCNGGTSFLKVSPNSVGSGDTNLSRLSAGVVALGTGGASSYAGSLKLTNTTEIGYHEMVEMSAPSAPAADTVRIYAVDNGAGKTQLMALFASGAAQQIAIQP